MVDGASEFSGALFVTQRSFKKKEGILMKTKKLVTSAMLIAIATVLSVIQPFQLPFGGGVTLCSMLPMVLISYIYGLRHGLFCGCIYGFLQMAIGSKTVAAFFLPGDSQMTLFAAVSVCLLDYILAYTALGIGGVFKGIIKNDTVAICTGCVVALTARYMVHVVSGTIFFGSWAEWFFTQEGFYAIGEKIVSLFSGTALAIIYSMFYNGLYMLPETVITTVVLAAVYRACNRILHF